MDLSVLDRHQKIALQFSGGKDSLACVFLLKDYWDRLTVYYLDTGDSFPETRETVACIKSLVPNFVVVQGKSKEVRQTLGIPSDIVPVSATEFGRVFAGHDSIAIIDRYTCCFHSIMLPMHQQMIKDQITLIIRGQKQSDKRKSPVKSGETVEGFEFLYPFDTWADEAVMEYLDAVDAPIPRFYKTLTSAPDCMTCTGWLEERRSAFLKTHHPEAYAIYLSRIRLIKNEVAVYCDLLYAEVSP